MFSHFSAIIAVSFAVLIVANPIEVRTGTSECNTGEVYCCDNTQDSSIYTGLFPLWGIPTPSSSSLVGISCSPITADGTGTGGNCVSQPVCCTDVYFNGEMNVGCNPTTEIS
ncbi:hypothetical protein ID866_1096 [Astraeus odoratus]|nr:hypothetical protein ID866_1096 [Astraeus odoratus]